MRDLTAIGTKIVQVLNPTAGQAVLRDWDLWGPLIVRHLTPTSLLYLTDEFEPVLSRFGRAPFCEWSAWSESCAEAMVADMR